MAMYTSNSPAILRPEDVGDLIVRPVIAASVALATTTVARSSSRDYRIPVVAADPTAAWVAEGADIVASDAQLAEVVVTPAKVAGLTIMSAELAHDSDPAAANAVGQGLARDIARRVDQAFYGNLAAPAPTGLAGQTGIREVAAPLNFGSSLDAFANAVSQAEREGATVTTFAVNPATALMLATMKESDGTRKTLLGQDPTEPGVRRILGVPVVVSPTIADRVVWCYDRSRVVSVVREDVDLAVDESVFFTSHRVAVRAVMRVGFGFPHTASVVRITAAAV